MTAMLPPSHKAVHRSVLQKADQDHTQRRLTQFSDSQRDMMVWLMYL